MINNSRTSTTANLLRSASPTLIVSALILIALYLISLQSYLIFHGVIEIISVAIAVSIFILIWNTRQTAHDTFFLIIGISLLFIGSIDLIHMLAYKGMGVFSGISADLPTQLWIAARYFQSIAFFAATLLIGKSLSKDRKYDVWIIFAACAAAFILLMMSIFVWHNFPPCFIEGSGLTPFKIASEYVISLIMAATIGILVIKRRYLDTEVWYLLIAAQLFLIFGELAFTSYISVYGFMNMLGHLFKLIAFYLFYRAIVVVGLTRPYALIFRELKESEENLRESENKLNDILRNSPIPQFVINQDHKVIHWNEALERYSGIAAKDIVGTNLQWRAFYRDERPCMADLLLDGLIEKIPHWYCGKYEKSKRNEDAYEAIDFFPHMNGSGLWLHFTAAPIRDTAGQITGAVETVEDITEVKNAEAYRQLSADVLGILNEPAELQEMIRHVLDAIKRATNADAVGIRLKAADDFPYFVEKGFSNDFLLTENTLVAREQNGGICRNSEGNVNLECTCGLVISGKTDPKNPLFTQGGSFWTNHSFPLLDLPSGQDPSEFRLRNTCIHKGYASFAIIPIRTHQQQIIGTLQINCFKKNCFTISGIQSLELIAGHISEALMRKTAEMALVESEDKFRSLTESSPDYILRYDRQCRHTYINPAALRAYEREEEQMLGKTDRENGLDESMSRFWEETITGVFETKKLFQTQIAWERVNGSILLDVMLTPEFSENNTVRSVLSVSRDITQIERSEEALLKKNEELSASYEQITTSEEALRETNAYLNNLFDYANAPIIVWDPEGQITRFNHAFEHLTGRKEQDVLQQPLGILFPEESRDISLELIKTTTGGKRWETVKIPILAADGTEHTVLWNSANILSAEGELESTIAQGVDITLREQAEDALAEKNHQLERMNEHLTATEQELRATLEDLELGERKLRKSEERLRLLSDNLPNGMIYQAVIEKDGKRRFTYISAGVEQNHGVTAEDVLHDPMVLYNQFSEEDSVRVAEAEDLALKNRTVFDTEVMYRIPSGQLRWVHLRSVSRELPGGDTIWDGFEIDITKRKNAEEELAITHSRLESAMKSGTIAWWEMDCVTGNVIFNERKAQMLGYPAEQFSHYTDFTKLVHPDDYDAIMQQMRDHLNGITKQYDVNYRMRSANGEYLWFHDIGGISGHASDGSPLKVSGLVMDITKRKVAEEALRASEQRFTLFMENLPAAVYLKDLNGRVVFSNRYLNELFGWSETAGKSTLDLLPQKIAQQMIEDDKKAFDQGVVSTVESITDVHGRKRFFNTTKFAVSDSTGSRNLGGISIDITERKMAEGQLLLKNNVFESSIAANSIADKQGIITHVNPAFLKLWGHRTQEEAIGNSVSSFFAREEDGTPVLEALNALGRWEGVFLAKRTDGSTFISQGIATVISDETGEPIGYQSTNLDISERKIAEEALRESEEKYHNIYRNAALGIFHSTFAGRFIDVNPALVKMLGYNSSEEVVKTITSIADQIYVEPPLRDEVNIAALSAGGTISVENQYRRKDGTRWYGMLHLRIVPEKQGKPRHFEGFVEDITERKMAEVALRESEEQSRTINNSMLFGIAIVDAKTHAIIDVNDKALEMIGGGRDIVIGSVCHQFICPAEPGKCPVTDLGQTVNCSDRVLLNIGGERIPIFKSVVRTTLKGKDVLIESFVDITERKRSEEALIDSERTINILLNAVPDNLALINHEKMIIAVNESMAATLGQQPEALTGKAILDFLTSSVLYDTIDRSIDSTMTGGQMYFEERQNERWLETSVYPVTDRNGTEVRIVIQSRDITERKYLEEELKKVGLSQAELNIEKFQTLNDQIRNPLQVIRGYTSLDPSKYNDKINKQVEIIDNIVTQLDMGWLESEKVQQFLLKHTQHSNQSLRKQQPEGGLR